MLKQISWSEFITFFLIVLGIYYLIIGFKYYRKDILQLVNRNTGKKNVSTEIDAGSIKEKSTR
ncbi:MAG TPA: hypothetical protein VIH86_02910 [Puia sp.]